MIKSKEKGCKVMKVKILLFLGIISMTLFIGCESDRYPIYKDWLCR